jgi:putative toxin-antitoxin system antitoxin component (TIGR02293 family)
MMTHQKSPAEPPPTASYAPLNPPAAAYKTGESSAIYLLRLDPQERIDLIRQGIPAATIGRLSARMGLSKETLLASLGLPRATISRKEKDATTLSKDESERVLGFETLIDQVQTIVDESGDPSGFDAARWLAGWITKPLPALGGATPASYMDTFEGQRLVTSMLAMAQSGAYA